MMRVLNEYWLTASLEAQRLAVRASLHKPRFVPRGENETLAAIFTMWNVLDRLMLQYLAVPAMKEFIVLARHRF